MKRRDTPRQVAAHQCTECLFSPQRIVSEKRFKQIVERCRRRNKYFLCHKGKNLICRGSWELQTPPDWQQVAAQAGWVIFVDPAAQQT